MSKESTRVAIHPRVGEEDRDAENHGRGRLEPAHDEETEVG